LSCQSRVRGGITTGSVVTAVRKAWLRCLPADMLPNDFYYQEEARTKHLRPSVVDWQNVQQCKRFLRKLVVMGIDKCPGRLLIVCPALFQRFYDATFPVEVDHVHFTPINKTPLEYAKELKQQYHQKRWYKVATLMEDGSAPSPYPLFKLKDILASCSTVFASKGKCCRNRPISPNTKHWYKRVYKRAGSILRYLCSNLPSKIFNIMSSTVLKPRLEKAKRLANEAYGDQQYNWATYTGDISNCYDELVHDRILEAVQFWCKAIPALLGRRRTDRFSVNKYNRKICVMGNDNTGGDYITITIATLMEICKFDCENSVLQVRGKLYRRKLGAPMGGYLSAFYAMLTFAYREFTTLYPTFEKLALPGWMGRYLDDVIAAIAYKDQKQLVQIQEFIQWLGSHGAYEEPLVLNVEPEGDQEFLEAKVYHENMELWARLHNKVTKDFMARLPPYRRRLPDRDSTPKAEQIKLVASTMTRIRQLTKPDVSMLQCLIDLKLETEAAGYASQIFLRAARSQWLSTSNVLKEEEKELFVLSTQCSLDVAIGNYTTP